MNDVAGLIDPVVGRIEEDVALDVDLDQARGCVLVEEHAIGVYQELILRLRDPGRDMAGDHLRHAELRDQSVARRQVDTRFPLFGAHQLRYRLDDRGLQPTHDSMISRLHKGLQSKSRRQPLCAHRVPL